MEDAKLSFPCAGPSPLSLERRINLLLVCAYSGISLMEGNIDLRSNECDLLTQRLAAYGRDSAA